MTPARPPPRPAVRRQASGAGVGARRGAGREQAAGAHAPAADRGADALASWCALLCVIGLVMVGTASSVISICALRQPVGDPHPRSHVDGHRRRGAGRGAPLRLSQAAPLQPALLLGHVRPSPRRARAGGGGARQGSSRWVGFGQFRLQPSELMKLALTLFAADFIARRLDEDASDRRIIGPVLLVTRPAGRADPGAAGHGYGHGARVHRSGTALRLRACGWAR